MIRKGFSGGYVLEAPSSGRYADCRQCPGFGKWDHHHYKGQDLCFRKAIFEGRSGGPENCVDARKLCGRFISQEE